MKKHGSTLQDKLARSLDQANAREKKAHRQAPPLRGPAGPAPLPADVADRWPNRENKKKLSISLFSGDLARLAAIMDYMEQRGHRLSTSQAIKLALRTAALTPDMDKALDAIRSEDGRKW